MPHTGGIIKVRIRCDTFCFSDEEKYLPSQVMSFFCLEKTDYKKRDQGHCAEVEKSEPLNKKGKELAGPASVWTEETKEKRK